jgi:hypothetical protein
MAFLHRLANLFYASRSLTSSDHRARHALSECALIVRRRTRRDEEEGAAF